MKHRRLERAAIFVLGCKTPFWCASLRLRQESLLERRADDQAGWPLLLVTSDTDHVGNLPFVFGLNWSFYDRLVTLYCCLIIYKSPI